MTGKSNKLEVSGENSVKSGETPDASVSRNEVSEILELAPDAFFRGDPQGKFLYVNQSAVDLTGYTRGELLKMEMGNLFDKATLAEKPLRYDLLKEGKAIATERKLRTKSGELIPVEMHSRMMPDGTFQSFIRDVSERKRNEEAFRDLVEKAGIAILIDDADGKFNYFNRKFAELFGYSASEIRTKSIQELVHPDDVDRVMGFHNKRVSGEKAPSRYEFRGIRRDGTIVYLEVDAVPLDASGRYIGTRSYLRDVSNRKRAEEMAAEREARIISIFRSAPVGIGVVSNRLLLEVNEEFCRMTGYSADELIGQNARIVYPSDAEFQKVGHDKYEQIDKYGTGKVETRLLRKNGEIINVVLSSTPIDPDDLSKGVTFTALDITDRKEAENALRKSEEKFRTLIDKATDSIFLSDLNGRIIEANRKAWLSLGYTREEIIGKKVTDLDPEFEEMDHVHTVWDKLLPGQTMTIESTHQRKDGSTFPVEINTGKVEIDGKPAILGVVRDISKRKQAEEKLFEAQKMDSIGNLAGGVAHDFNNMLGGIMGYASLLLMQEADPKKKNSIEAIIRAAERASELTQKLLAFGRKGKHLVQPVNLNETIHEVYGLLMRSVDKKIEFEADLSGNLFTVDGDPAQMHQVVMNLCINASHAMPEGGTLSTSTRNIVLDAVSGHRWPDLAPGDYVEVVVTDSGHGMDEDTRKRAFEPFFSTKEDGVVKGSGLGLATVYGIVRNHGGSVGIESAVGKGTFVTVLLPRGNKEAELKTTEAEKTESGHGRILVVDDEDIVREMAKDMLKSLGYEVMSAGDGLEAVRIYEHHHGEIDGVLIDLKMPKMDGKEAFSRMKQINPDVRALLSTGYGLNEEAQSVLDAGAMGLVPKPYRLQELSDSIKKLLS